MLMVSPHRGCLLPVDRIFFVPVGISCCLSELSLHLFKFTYAEKFCGNHSPSPHVTLLTQVSDSADSHSGLHTSLTSTWESYLWSLKIPFPWVFGLYKIQLLDSNAHSLEEKILLTSLHLISSPYGFDSHSHLWLLCRGTLNFHLFEL